MQRVFVTGAQGFVGRYLVSRLLERNQRISVLGIGRSADQRATFTHVVRLAGEVVPAPLPPDVAAHVRRPSYAYRAVDLNDVAAMTALLRDFAPNSVFHLASGLRDDDPRTLFRTNVDGTIALLDAIDAAKVQPDAIVLGSSGGVYGAAAELPIGEHARCEPVDLYSVSKLASEHASRIVARSAVLPVIWARLFNIVGAGQDERHVCGRFASQIAAIALDRTPGELHTGDLTTTRDFIDVRDLADALILLAARATPGMAYNVGSGEETLIQSILYKMLANAGLEDSVTLTSSAYRNADVRRHVADITQLRSLGFARRFSLDESVADVYRYYLGAFAATGSVPA